MVRATTKGKHMARGLNKVSLIGNTGNDVDLKYTQGGMAFGRVGLATTFEWKDKDGNKQSKTEWHRLVFRGKLAEIAAQYVKKGHQIYIEGRISYDKFTGTDGVEKYTTDIFVNEMQMLGGNGNGNGNNQGQAQRPAQNQEAGSAPNGEPPMDDFAEDQIPF